MSIWAHSLVCNEERFVWYSIMSAINHVDKVLVWDTGSEDRTLEIVAEITKANKDKVNFKKLGKVSKEEFPSLRQKMLDETKAEWILTLDGDEVWWEESIAKLIQSINNSVNQHESIVVKTVNCVGDIYHYQGEEGARYEFLGKKGHYNLRAFSNKIPGLHAKGEHGNQGYFDVDETPIQEHGDDKVILLPVSYMHMTHLQRSSKVDYDKSVPLRSGKFKYELGIPLPLDFYYPEVFFRPKSDFVPSPWVKLHGYDLMRSHVETPPRRIKRLIK